MGKSWINKKRGDGGEGEGVLRWWCEVKGGVGGGGGVGQEKVLTRAQSLRVCKAEEPLEKGEEEAG